MPHRLSLHSGKSTSPHQSTHAVNDAASAVVNRKLNLSHAEELAAEKSPLRRQSFSMNAILHPGKDKDHHKRGDSKDREARKNKRSSLTRSLRASSKSKDARTTHSPQLAPISPGRFDMIIESPPLVFYGSAQTSTGALLSGRLKLDVTDPAGEVRLTKLDMTLNAAIVTKKPVAKDCAECAQRVNHLNTWNFLSEPITYHVGKNTQFPFSFLLPGHLPATTVSSLGSVSYHLEVKGLTSNSEEIHLIHPLRIDRATPPGPDKSSVRIFPPTNLTCRFIMPPVIYPIGTFPLQMIISGVVDKKIDSQTRWRLRKVIWRIDELTKMVSPACPKHGHKLGGEGKALQHDDERTIGSDELKSGWKTDFDTQGGEITLEFEASLSPAKHPICDMDSPAGLEVKHNLLIELIIAEEYCPNKNTSLITPTGAARVLRMQFGLAVTERAGMGISWDEEMPPVYEDVPDSPPRYGNSDRNGGAFSGAIMEDYEGPELEYVDLERMHSDNPSDPPVYRQRDPSEYVETMAAPTRNSAAAAASAASPRTSLGPSSPRFRPRRASSSSFSAHGHMRRPIHHGLTEDDFGIEPPEYLVRPRPRSEESQGQPVEDVGEGETS